MPEPWGEVIAADTVQIEAESPRLYHAPNFGGWVRAESEGLEIYGVVCHIATGCIDSNRRTQALGLSADEIAQKMPHLDLVLRTTFTARVVGFRKDGEIYSYLPEQPARIHRFVFEATDEEIRALTRATHFLRILATAPDLPVEDLIAGAMRRAGQAWGADPAAADQYVRWGKYLARLFRNDYDCFEAILHRLPPTLSPAHRWEEPLPISGRSTDPFE